MIRRLIPLLPCLALCAALMSGCIDLPFVISQEPFYPDDDPGVAVPNMVGGGWTNPGADQLKIEPDSGTGQPGDYIMTFTGGAYPEPMPDQENNPVPRDASKPENNDQLEVHVFEVDGQTYMDITSLQPLAEPLPDVPNKRGPGKDGHILCRLSVGLNQIGLEMMDPKWFATYVEANKSELGVMYPEPLPDSANTPLIHDSRDKIAAFLKKHANDGLWGQAVRFSRPE